MPLPDQKRAVCSYLPSECRDTKYQAKQSMEQQHNAYFIVVSVYILKLITTTSLAHVRDCAIHVFEGVLLQKNGFHLSWEVIILISAAVPELVTNRDDKCNASYHTGSKHNQEPLVVKNSQKYAHQRGFDFKVTPNDTIN